MFPQETSGFRTFSRGDKNGALAWYESRTNLYQTIDGNGLTRKSHCSVLIWEQNILHIWIIFIQCWMWLIEVGFLIFCRGLLNYFKHVFLKECSLKQRSRNGIYVYIYNASQISDFWNLSILFLLLFILVVVPNYIMSGFPKLRIYFQKFS